MKRRERKLLKALRRGDRTACVELIDLHYRDVFWYLADLSGDRELAADLTQNTFAKAWQAVGSYRGGASFRTWLFAIARNEFLQDLRSRGRQAETIEFVDLEVIEAPDEPVDVAITREELGRIVRDSVEELPGLYREVLSLHYFARMTLKEVAAVLDVPAGTAKSRVNKALGLLRDQLEKVVTGDEEQRAEASSANG